jgi:hypothetical protein
LAYPPPCASQDSNLPVIAPAQLIHEISFNTCLLWNKSS